VKLPLKIDGVELLYEVFTEFLPGVDPEKRDRVVTIEDRTYRVRAGGDGMFYTMFRIGRHQRTVRGEFDRIVRVVAMQHLIYRRYEIRVRKAKESAQATRDRQLNELVEAAK
jgi:hypothetical protein